MKETKHKNINFNYSEEFITNNKNITIKDLKNIFNQKYYNYIKILEHKKLESNK